MALPKRIVEAATRARDTRVPELSALPRRARALLAYIVEHVSANDPATRVKHDDDYIASRLACSRRTVVSAANDLEQVSLIERPQQTRLRGRFHSSGYKLTSTAITLLFSPCAKSANEIINTVPTTVVINNDNACPISQASQEPMEHPVRFGKIVLPPSLANWVETGLFTAEDLVSLMNQAKKANTKLQDVLIACKAYLTSGLRKPAAYVASLLKSGKDWSYIARSTQKQQEAKSKQTDAEAKRNELYTLLKNASSVTWKLENMTVTMDRYMHLAVQADGDIVRYTPMDLHWAVRLHAQPYKTTPLAPQNPPDIATNNQVPTKPLTAAKAPQEKPIAVRLGNYRTEQGLIMTVVQKARQLMIAIAGNHLPLPSSAMEAIRENRWEYVG